MAAPALSESVNRLRIADSYGLEWGNLLGQRDTDPLMISDVVAVVREHIKIDELGFFLAFDNSEPPQLWVWRGERNETAEPWMQVT